MAESVMVVDPAEAIAASLPPELAEVAEGFREHVNENRKYALYYLKHLNDTVLPSGLPWTTHLLIMFILMPPDRRHLKRSLEEHYCVYGLLHARWKAAGKTDPFGNPIEFTADQSKSYQGKEAIQFLKKYNNLVEKKDLFSRYQLKYVVHGKDKAVSWKLLKPVLSPDLYELCTALVPEESPHFEHVKYIIKRVLGKDREKHPFLQQLVLMAIALSFDEKGLTAKRKDINRVGNHLSKVLQTYRISPEDLDPDVHLVDYIQGATGEIGRFNQAYQLGALAVEALLVRAPTHEDTIRTWQLRPMDAEVRPPVILKDDDEDGQATREEIDLARTHWNTIHALVETRALAVRLIMLEFRTALAGRPEGPFPLTFTVCQPDDTVWPFRIWTMESYVTAHPDLFEPGWLDTRRATSAPFLEWQAGDEYSLDNGLKASTPWFVSLLAYQNASPKNRADFIGARGYTEATFAKDDSYPTLNPRPLNNMLREVANADIQAGRPPRCLFEPCELFGDVLTALLNMRMSRTTGGRQHELLQLRLEPEFLSEAPTTSRVSGSQGVYIKVQLKGDKATVGREATVSQHYIPERTLLTILDLHDLRTYTGQGRVVVRPADPSLQGLPAGQYLLHNGRTVLRPGEMNRRLRFLLFGWEAAVNIRRNNHLKAHDLRHGFATMLALSGFRMATIAGILGHASERMTRRYARLPRDMQQEMDGNLKRTIRDGLNSPRKTVFINHQPLIGNEPRNIGILRLSPFLTNIYAREDQIRDAIAELTGV